jgi:hypothetical protein
MDEKKLSSLELLAQGIVAKPAPETDIPEDRPSYSYDAQPYDKEKRTTNEELKALLLQNRVIRCSEYYGIPYIWQNGNIFRGVLLQYRSVTEDKTFDTADEAIEWFVDRAERCAG